MKWGSYISGSHKRIWMRLTDNYNNIYLEFYWQMTKDLIVLYYLQNPFWGLSSKQASCQASTLSSEQALNMGKSREVTRERHAKEDPTSRLRHSLVRFYAARFTHQKWITTLLSCRVKDEVSFCLASHAGVFRGDRFSSWDDKRAPLKTPAWEATFCTE